MLDLLFIHGLLNSIPTAVLHFQVKVSVDAENVKQISGNLLVFQFLQRHSIHGENRLQSEDQWAHLNFAATNEAAD